MEFGQGSLAGLGTSEEEVEREWLWLHDTLTQVVRVRAEYGDAQAFRLMEAQACEWE